VRVVLDRLDLPALRTALAGLESDYATLFARHTAATPA
jgi:hypothetical protein